MAGILIGWPLLSGAVSVAQERVSIAAADFRPTLAPQPGVDRIHVAAFRLDPQPVTNAQFLQFVLEHPQWRRGRVVALFADADYLSHWAGPTNLGHAVLPQQPVTRVSWFAARAYCASNTGRLPTWSEWELAAAADPHVADARNDPAWRSGILDWYAKPASYPLSEVGMSPRNVYGVQDLHGLIWEWVADFGALMVSGEAFV